VSHTYPCFNYFNRLFIYVSHFIHRQILYLFTITETLGSQFLIPVYNYRNIGIPISYTCLQLQKHWDPNFLYLFTITETLGSQFLILVYNYRNIGIPISYTCLQLQKHWDPNFLYLFTITETLGSQFLNSTFDLWRPDDNLLVGLNM